MEMIAEYTDSNPDGLTATVWRMTDNWTVTVQESETKTAVAREVFPGQLLAVTYARRVCNIK